MPDSAGSQSPFRRLHGAQAATTFAQTVCPPFERGTTWSKVKSSRTPQYWQVKRSRKNPSSRGKAGGRGGFQKFLSEPAEGSRNSKLGDRPRRSYSETMFTRSMKTA